jgi:hypothetical protein
MGVAPIHDDAFPADTVRIVMVWRAVAASRAPGEQGMLRDSAMFSVITAGWPAVKSALVTLVRRAGQRPEVDVTRNRPASAGTRACRHWGV